MSNKCRKILNKSDYSLTYLNEFMTGTNLEGYLSADVLKTRLIFTDLLKSKIFHTAYTPTPVYQLL